MTEGVDGVDPGTAVTKEQFAERLRDVHVLAGEPAYSELVKRNGALSTSTIQRAFSGNVLPTARVLIALLDALGVDRAVQERWYVKRANVARGDADADPARSAEPPSGDPVSDEAVADNDDAQTHDGERPLPIDAAPQAAPTRSSGRHWLIAGGVAVVLMLAAVVGYVILRPTTEIPRCDPPGCIVTGGTVAVWGQLPRRPPPGHEAWVLTRVDTANRWYLATAILPDDAGNWTAVVGIGNPQRQENDRYFTICSYFLASSALPELRNKLLAHDPEGVAPEELPADRTELTCVKAVRLKHT